MIIEDLRKIDTGRVISTDLCIVGSGPAGLTVAGEFANTKVRVLVLESGGLQEEASTDSLNEIESVGAPRELAGIVAVRNRVFGGTSQSWAGRCTPLDDIDFKVRPWVPHSGWPFARSELAPYFDRTAPYLGIAPQGYDGMLWHRPGEPELDTSLVRPYFWQHSQDATSPSKPMRFGPRFARMTAPNIQVLHHATVRRINLSEAGTRQESILVGCLEGKTATVRPKVLVLCAGGIETVRLLLCSNNIMPTGVGNAHDLVGRFFMDHPRCDVGEFDIHSAARILDRLGRRPSYIHGVALGTAAQEKMELLNCAAWLDCRMAKDDPLTAAKRLLTGHGRRLVPDALNVVSHPGMILRGLRDRTRGAAVTHKYSQLPFRCDVEQQPDPESRIRLANRADALGMNLPQIDWRISDREKASIATLGKLIVEQFSRIGFPVPRLADWITSGRHDEAKFIDTGHPTGGTRMAEDSHEGVVDANSQIHGVEGVFIAGSSVFPTGGHANPTQTIVALSIRLAERLKSQIFHDERGTAGGL